MYELNKDRISWAWEELREYQSHKIEKELSVNEQRSYKLMCNKPVGDRQGFLGNKSMFCKALRSECAIMTLFVHMKLELMEIKLPT